MSDYVTLRGFVATTPDPRVMPDGTAVTSFRLASTPRWYDAQAKEWKDGHTNWFTVTSFRGLAGNVASSIQVGQPVIVQGRLRIKHWESEGTRRTTVEIEAAALGIDLSFGTARFSRNVSGKTAEESAPENSTSGWDRMPATHGPASHGSAMGQGHPWPGPHDPVPEPHDDSREGPDDNPDPMTEAAEDDDALRAMT